MLKHNEVGVFAVGGLLEVGKNCYGIQYRDEIILIDFGSLFPDDSLLGVDAIIPDLNYINENSDKIVGLFITHGHLDHIGGISVLLDHVPIKKIYANGFAEGLIRKQIGDKRADQYIKTFEEDDVITSKYFAVTFYRTNHSIPDSFGIIIKTPAGNIIHSGDFKFDLTPIGPATNFIKMSQVANEGVLALLSDSTNAALPGFTMSERKVGDSIHNIFENIKGRVIVASFASNIHRIKQIVEAAVSQGRKLYILGRSMENNIKVAREMGYINAPESVFIGVKEFKSLPHDEVAVLSTGSQGEPLAALSRIAAGQHQHVKIIPGDTVIFSSSPIPGNRYAVNETVNKLYRQGAKVIVNSQLTDTHTSGHGAAGEQALLLSLIKPKHFIPIHGEYHMLVEHKHTAVDVGVAEENVHILSNGDILAFEADGDGVRIADHFDAEGVFVRGRSVNEISNAVLRQRKQISENGILSVVITVNKNRDNIIGFPIISSRGFVYMRDNTELTNRIKSAAKDITIEHLIGDYNKESLVKKLFDQITSMVHDLTERNPVVVPVVMEVE